MTEGNEERSILGSRGAAEAQSFYCFSLRLCVSARAIGSPPISGIIPQFRLSAYPLFRGKINSPDKALEKLSKELLQSLQGRQTILQSIVHDAAVDIRVFVHQNISEAYHPNPFFF